MMAKGPVSVLVLREEVEHRRNHHTDRPETIHQKDLKILKSSTFKNVVLKYMKDK